MPGEGTPRDDRLEHIRQIVAPTLLLVNADFQSGYANKPDTVAANVTLRIITGSGRLILRRFKLSEFFFGVGHVGFVRAAELKQSLLTPQIRFGEFKLSGLAFCYRRFGGYD